MLYISRLRKGDIQAMHFVKGYKQIGTERNLL